MVKITIVGSGNVGIATAIYCAELELGNIVLIDIKEGLPQGKALDLAQAMPISGKDAKIIGTNDYADTKDSNIVVITAGLPRKEGMTRDDLIEVNAKIMIDVVENIMKHSPACILIIVSNPLDAMAYVAYKKSGIDKQKIMGMAGCLDSTRFRRLIADELNVSVKDVSAFVLGGHGDSMVPMLKDAKVKDKPITKLMDKEKIDEIIKKTKYGGAEFLPLMNTSAWIAPGRAIAEMVESIVKDKKSTLPVSVLIDEGFFIGLPTVLGKNGVENIIIPEMDEFEKELFNKSKQHMKELVGKADSLL